MKARQKVEESESSNERLFGQIREVILPILSAHHVELFDLSMQVRQGNLTLRLTIDTPASTTRAVTVDDCADVSRDVSMALDVNDPIGRPYTLEVSSPGVERPLRNVQDCERFKGKLAKFVLIDALADGQRAVRGHLDGVEADAVAVITEHGSRILLEFSNVRKAQLIYESPGQRKQTSSKRKKKKR